jgi:ABC-type Fe3+/spermidine/putrescine transport system ATPase subunit
LGFADESVNGVTLMLIVNGVSKAFGTTQVLREVSLTVADGEIACLLGPSGCGKTTLLRIVAGLEQEDAGTVSYAGRDLTQVAVHQRGFGLMFQDFALFPHRSVADNIAFGLRMQGAAPDRIRQRVAEMLALVNLHGFGLRRVHELSGGEQQRVALARSLAPQPQLLMLDEPLGALDRTLRAGLLSELRTILKRVGLTTLYVTHDQQEAFAIADHILIMRDGQIVQRGAPEAVYQQPATRAVAQFLGLNNLIPGRWAIGPRGAVVQTDLGPLQLAPATSDAAQPGHAVILLIRPEAARVAVGGATDSNLIHGQVVRRTFRGSHFGIEFQADGLAMPLQFELPLADVSMEGARLSLALTPGALTLIAA